MVGKCRSFYMVSSQSINHTRARTLNDAAYANGPIVYWMSRDQRVHDNWALLYAQQLASAHAVPLVVVFCLRKKFRYATSRMLDFMLRGLAEVEQTLQEKDIPFFLLLGEPAEEIEEFVNEKRIGAVVSDFSPLRYNRVWKDSLGTSLTIPFFEVDAHNIVPVWVASPKQEFGAYTLRPKIHRMLSEYLTQYPTVKKQEHVWNEKTTPVNWEHLRHSLHEDISVPPITWCMPGEKAADDALTEFLEERLVAYATDRNDPTKHAQSELSPYLHFGQLSAQRVALEIERIEGMSEAKNAFLEELIIRKELSDNFCFYNPHYDSTKGFPTWAQKTIDEHRQDKREFIYTRKELEDAKTHDDLWNAAQLEMVKKGKMHGYLRMYWAKKIYEWSVTPEDAMEHAIYLNDTYFLDGRDPNGYVGIAWSMGGVHDRAWFERTIFGKLRYMSYNGAKGKFDIKAYVQYVNGLS